MLAERLDAIRFLGRWSSTNKRQFLVETQGTEISMFITCFDESFISLQPFHSTHSLDTVLVTANHYQSHVWWSIDTSHWSYENHPRSLQFSALTRSGNADLTGAKWDRLRGKPGYVWIWWGLFLVDEKLPHPLEMKWISPPWDAVHFWTGSGQGQTSKQKYWAQSWF